MKKFQILFLSILFCLSSYGQIISSIVGDLLNEHRLVNTPVIPRGIDIDSMGNIFITDLNTFRIIKISPGSNKVITIAGTGFQGTGGDGIATAISLNKPNDLQVDQNGNVYFIDNNRIRKVAMNTGIISTIAGGDTLGYSGDNGLASLAQLNNPTSIALDKLGNIYIADYGNNRVRKVTVNTGIISTVAGNGVMAYLGDGDIALKASLYAPTSVGIDDSLNIYIVEKNQSIIRKVIANSNIITRVAGDAFSIGFYSGDGGPAISAGLGVVRAIDIDILGNIYMATSANGSGIIRKVTTSTGIISRVAGGGQNIYDGVDSPATSNYLNIPIGITIDNSGNIYFADYGNKRIRKIFAATGNITTIIGNGGNTYNEIGASATSAILNAPKSTSFDVFGNLYIADAGNNRICKVSAKTGIISTIVGGGLGMYDGTDGIALYASLNNPTQIALDDLGNIFLADYTNHCIRKVNAKTGVISNVAGKYGHGFEGDGGLATSALLYFPYGMSVDKNENIYISEYGNNRIRKVSAQTGIISTIAGNGIKGFGGDGGLAILANLDLPSGIAVDNDGNIYFADKNNNRIRKIDAITNIISTVVGSGNAGYRGDGGPATSADLFHPVALAIDSFGDIYIADLDNNRVRRVSASTGIIYTVAGNGIKGLSGDSGLAISAKLNGPSGITIDGVDNLYIADAGNNRIRKVTSNFSNVGLNNIFLGKEIKIYPNPATSELHVETEGPEKLSLQLFDITGKEATEPIEFVRSTSINTQDLYEGIYFLKIKDENGSFVKTEKVLVLR